MTDIKWLREECLECGSVFGVQVRELLHSEQTEFQRIDIYASEKFGNVMVIDGFFMLTARENFFYHEMMSHPVLFMHPSPENVVIIGGGDCGTLREVLRHGLVTRALQVEIDERVTRLAEEFFPELCISNADPRAEFLFGDGIRWMKEADPGSVDVVIVDSTDPIGPAEGLFNEAFYRDVHKTLGKDGLLVQQSESPLFHMRLINSMHRAMRAAGFVDVKTLFFPQPCYPSGWWSATMAGKSPLEGRFRKADAQAKGFDTQYYNAAMHEAAFTAPEFFSKGLE